MPLPWLCWQTANTVLLTLHKPCSSKLTGLACVCEDRKRAFFKPHYWNCLWCTAVLRNKNLTIVLTGDFDHGLSLFLLKTPDREVNHIKNLHYRSMFVIGHRYYFPIVCVYYKCTLIQMYNNAVIYYLFVICNLPFYLSIYLIIKMMEKMQAWRTSNMPSAALF